MIDKQKIGNINITLFMKEFDPKLIIGVRPDGENLTISLSNITHLLFGGQSGSGKSVFVLQLFLQMLFLTNPKSLQFILIDPLRVSFKDFKTLPHLLTPIGSTPQDANKAIEEMMDINNERYIFLEGVGFENIYDYNKALLKNKIPYKNDNGSKTYKKLEDISQKYINKTKTEHYRLGEPMSQIVVVFDEFNALMLDEEFGGKNPEKAESPSLKKLTGISEQARKAGIIIILGTQKITAATVPTKIRENMKTRICLKVNTTMASRMILGDSVNNKGQGAKLSGLGDGLVYNPELSIDQALRFQGSFTPEEDMMKVVNSFIKVYGINDFDYIQVNEDYAKNASDLEMLPIDSEIFIEGLPDVMIVQDNVFMKEQYQKIISEIIRNPKVYDPKYLALSFPSISTKELKLITFRLEQSKILGVNKNSIDDESDDDKKKEKDKNDLSFGLNLKLPGLKQVCNKLGQLVEIPDDWDNVDTIDQEYQNLMMKLLLIRLNKLYIPAAKKEKVSINDFL